MPATQRGTPVAPARRDLGFLVFFGILLVLCALMLMLLGDERVVATGSVVVAAGIGCIVVGTQGVRMPPD